MAKTTISAVARQIMVVRGATSSDMRIYLSYVAAAVRDYRTSYNPYSSQQKVELDSKDTFAIPDGYSGVNTVRVPYQGRLVQLWQLPDLTDTTTLEAGVRVRKAANGENVPLGFDEGDAVNPFGYYSIQDGVCFIYSEQKYPYLVVEFNGDGVINGETKIDTSYISMIEAYVKWQVEKEFGQNKSYVPLYKRDYEEEALKLRNSEMRKTPEEIAKLFVHGTFDNL